MKTYILLNNDYEIRTEEHQGVAHMVVPVVMMVEGVHSGSHGPLLHLAEELGRFPGSWDGIPVVVQHPQDADGRDVSANSPDVIDREMVGKIYNTHMEGSKLMAEAWINIDRISQVSPRALSAIKNKEELDVSIGVFTDEDNTSGEFEGVTYDEIARNHRPDHLALLPGATGACSWNDGCGIRLNKKGVKSVKNEKPDLIKTMKDLIKEGLAVVSIGSNEQGFREVTNKIQGILDAMDNDFNTYYLQETYEDYFVYRVSKRDGTETLYKDTYTVNEDETIELNGAPVEVRRKVEFVETQTNELKRTKFSNNKKEVNMSTEKKTPCCLAKIEQLINNVATHWGEDDKEYLLTQEEATLDKFFPKEAPKVEVNEVKKEVKEVKEEKKAKPLTYEELLKTASADVQERAARELRKYEEEKTMLVGSIVANAKEGVWNKEELEKMDITMLEKINSTVGTPVNFSGMGGKTPETNTKKVKPLLPPGVVIEKK